MSRRIENAIGIVVIAAITGFSLWFVFRAHSSAMAMEECRALGRAAGWVDFDGNRMCSLDVYVPHSEPIEHVRAKAKK